MKKCPQCGREYDNTMMFCLDDGAELLYGPAGTDEPATAIFSSAAAWTVAPSDSANVNSIAVLPFTHMSSDEDGDYFCDGLAEELLNALAKIDGLKVAARTSSFSFKNRDVDISEIGERLGVKNVLEGSVRKAGGRLRITTQLINAADGFHLWSERYDREMRDIFDIQDEITLAVVDALKMKLLGEQEAAVLKHQTRDPEALDHFLRAASYFSRFTPEFFRKAVDSLERAIAIDPDYAAAYASLAECYSEMSFFDSPAEWRPMARHAAEKAVELDGSLGRAHCSLGIVLMYFDRADDEAEREFKCALELDPGNAHIRMWYGWFLGLRGRFEKGLAEMTQALEVDPLSPLIAFGIGAINMWAGRHKLAVEQFKRLVEVHPEMPIGRQYLAEAYAASGDVEAACAVVDEGLAKFDDPFLRSAAGYFYALAGRQKEASEILAWLEAVSGREYELSVQVVQVYIGLGEMELAFKWLVKALETGSVWLNWMEVQPAFEPLRADPRFAAAMASGKRAG